MPDSQNLVFGILGTVGFLFVGGGDHQEQGLLYSAIKISYNAGGGSEQMFCNCTFSE